MLKGLVDGSDAAIQSLFYKISKITVKNKIQDIIVNEIYHVEEILLFSKLN